MLEANLMWLFGSPVCRSAQFPLSCHTKGRLITLKYYQHPDSAGENSYINQWDLIGYTDLYW